MTALTALLDYLRAGGVVAWILFGSSIVFWFLLFQNRQQPTVRSKVYADALLHVFPMLGLLGTVTGMVTLFASLGTEANLSTADRSVASGISTALVTTQLGLWMTVSGLAARMLLGLRPRGQA